MFPTNRSKSGRNGERARRWTLRAAAPLVALIFFGGCTSIDPIQPAAVTWGRADFSQLVILGDSFAAGVQSGGLAEPGQHASFVYRFALQAGATGFEIPTVIEPGVPKLFYLTPTATGLTITIPEFESAQTYQSRFTNLGLARPYNNLAVPGAQTAQMLTHTFTGNPQEDYFFLYASFILRPGGMGNASALEQAMALSPTFAIVELGINDAMRGILGGSPDLITPLESFEQSYDQVITGLAAAQAGGKRITGVAIVNIPTPLNYPVMTTIPWFAFNPLTNQPILDAQGNLIPLWATVNGQPKALAPGSLVNLQALALLTTQGYGTPNKPLPDALTLDNSPGGELSQAISKVNAMNSYLAGVARTNGYAFVDVNDLLARGKDGLQVGGTRYSAKFITGGFFSLDGIHPSNLGQAFAANDLIAAVNARYGSNIPPVDFNDDLGVNFGNLVASKPSGMTWLEAAERSNSVGWSAVNRMFGVPLP